MEDQRRRKVSSYNWDFYGLASLLEDSGFFEYALPFLIVFAIIFGILEKVKIFGSEKTDGGPRTGINAVVAAGFGLYLIVSTDVVEKVFVLIPKVGLLLILVLSFLMMVAFFMGEEPKFGGGMLFFAVVFALIATAWAVSSEGLVLEGWSYYWDNYRPFIVGLIILVAAMGIIVGTSKTKDSKWENMGNFMRGLGKT